MPFVCYTRGNSDNGKSTMKTINLPGQSARRSIRHFTPLILAVAASWLLALFAGPAAAQSVDAAAAESLAKKSKCTTCHTVDKAKDGPSYKETAAKYKAEEDTATAAVYKHDDQDTAPPRETVSRS